MKKDITNKDDIKLLVDTFYHQVKTNPVIGPVFMDIAQVDWEHHLPKMYSFWSGLLLGEPGFSGNPMQKHIALSKQTPMTEIQFNEWLQLFTQTVDQLFEGNKADEAKQRAESIAALMLHKIQTM